jgi:hypothetical protein
MLAVYGIIEFKTKKQRIRKHILQEVTFGNSFASVRDENITLGSSG